MTFKNNSGVVTKMVEYGYDPWNNLVWRSVDADGAGPGTSVKTYFVNDGTEAVLALSPTGAVKNRYLWAPTIDQVMADEQPATGDLLWTFTDNLGTVRELARYTGGVTSVANHRVFDSYGQLKSETNAAVDHLFAFTGRMLDEDTGLQQHLNRWYDPKVGRWLSEDPIGFEAGDVNVYRYVANEPGNGVDTSGFEIDSRIPGYLPIEHPHFIPLSAPQSSEHTMQLSTRTRRVRCVISLVSLLLLVGAVATGLVCLRGGPDSIGLGAPVQPNKALFPSDNPRRIAHDDLPPTDPALVKRVEELAQDGSLEASRQLSELFRRTPSRWIAERAGACLARHKRYEAAPLLMRYAMLGDKASTAALEQMDIPEAVSPVIVEAILAGRRVADENTRARLQRLLGEDVGADFAEWERLYDRLQSKLTPAIPAPIRDEVRGALQVMSVYDKAAFSYMAMKNVDRLPAPRPPDFTVRSTAVLEEAVSRYAQEVQVLSRSVVTPDGRQQVDLRGTTVTQEKLKFLHGFHQLDMLDLGNTNVDDAMLSYLPSLKGVAMFGLADTKVTEKGFISLDDISSLRSVDLDGTTIGDVAVERLAAKCDLEVLAIGRTLVTDHGLAFLRNERVLRKLHLDGTSVSDLGIGHLRDIQSIEELVLTDTSIGDTSMRYLAGLPRLRRLWADETEVTVEGVGQLVGRRLEVLSLRGLRVPNGDIRPLLKLDLVGELVLDGSPISDEAMTDLLSLSGLTLLSVGGTNITSKGISSASAKGLLKKLTSLNGLVLDDTPVDDEGIAALSELPNLHALSVNRTYVTALGIAECVSLSLEKLYLQGIDAGDDVLPSVSKMVRLRYLNLADTRISDAGIPDLAKMESLKKLYAWNTRLSPNGVAELRHRLPRATIVVREPSKPNSGAPD